MLDIDVAEDELGVPEGPQEARQRRQQQQQSSAQDSDTALMAAILNEIDYPLILLAQDMSPLYTNRAAQALLGRGLPGQSCAEDQARLFEALDGAILRGRRSLITVRVAGSDSARTPLAVIPQRDARGRTAALLILAKPQLCPELTLQSYARAMNLTDRETLVLQGLWAGLSPEAIARERGVALSTVRSQISALRAKTGAKDLKDVVHRIGMLPPLVHALCGKV